MPLSLVARRRLAHFFATAAELEAEVDAIRGALARRPTFSPHKAFAALDPQANGFFTSEPGADLQRYLRLHGVLLTDSEAYHLLSRLDTNSDGKVSYSEFLDYVLPTDAEERELTLSRELCFSPLHTRSCSSCCCCCCCVEGTAPCCCCSRGDACIAQLLLREVDVHRDLEVRRKILTGSLDFKLLAAFQFVEDPTNAAVTPASLSEALHGEGITLQDAEIDLIFRRLDRDCDGRLKYLEFVEAVMPSSCPASPLTTDPIPLRSSGCVCCLDTSRSQCLFRPQTAMLRSSSSSRAANRQCCSKFRNNSSNSFLLGRPCTTLDASKKPDSSPCRLQCSLGSHSTLSCRSTQNCCCGTRPAYRASVLCSSNNSGNNNIVASGCEVAGVLSTQIDTERKLERLREKLALKPDFNLLQFWGLFDTDGRGYATTIHVKDAFNAVGLDISFAQARLFAAKLSSDTEPRLKYADMAKAFLPTRKRYAEAMINRISTGNHKCPVPQRHLSPETLEAVAAIFDLTLASEEQAELSRHRMCLKDLSLAFQDLDKNGDGYVTAAEFSASLKAHGLSPSEAELNALVNRYDKNGDSKVSYSEFVNEIGRTRCPVGSCRLVCLCR